ncbi:hypothetical protein H8E50_01705 [bacterium]|nr:hypothetical protein [bacterium]
MKTILNKILFFDKPLLFIAALSIILLVISVRSSLIAAETVHKSEDLRSQYTVISSLSEEVIALKKFVTSQEGKLKTVKGSAVVSTLENILNELGLKADSIKPMQKKKIDQHFENDAEIEIESIDLNSIINLLYLIKNSRAPMKIKNSLIKTSFENPDKLILNLTVSLLSAA